MKDIIRILFFIILISFFIGFYLKNYGDNEVLAEKIIGSTVLISVLIFLPIFLYHRWRGKDLKNYTLTKENYERIRSLDPNKKIKNKTQ
tara:strand:- start:278 stop:544 length:267 start_codon:yes stop_codon:yes gene_type:complete